MEQLGPLGRIGRDSGCCIHTIFHHCVSSTTSICVLKLKLRRCLSQRRRRKAGSKPYYGTGWTYKLPGGGGQQYNPQYNQQQGYQAPQTYGNQNQGYNQSVPQGGYYGGNNTTGGGAAASYFGGQRNDPEMQSPQNVYNNGSGYAPPAGPPPGKNY